MWGVTLTVTRKGVQGSSTNINFDLIQISLSGKNISYFMNAELLTRINWFIHCQIWKYTYWKYETIVSSKPYIKCTRTCACGLSLPDIQGASNMTGTDLCVNKPHCAAAVRP